MGFPCTRSSHHACVFLASHFLGSLDQAATRNAVFGFNVGRGNPWLDDSSINARCSELVFWLVKIFCATLFTCLGRALLVDVLCYFVNVLSGRGALQNTSRSRQENTQSTRCNRELRRKSVKEARFRASPSHHLATHPSTITFATPAALAKSSSVTSR